MDERGLQLIKKLKELTKDRNIITPTGTLIQDKEFYFNQLEKYFNKQNPDYKWIEILEQIKNKIENENKHSN